MKQFILIAGLLLMPVFAAAAANAPEKPAATVIAVVGTPKMSVDGGKTLKGLKIGQSIPVGGLIRTGNGKLSLLLSEGSNVHLGNNCEMTLKAHNPEAEKGGTIFGLAKGFARFVVAKLQPGKHFEVETSNAVAAVKGTDFGAGVDENGETQVNVYDSPTDGMVQMSDLDRIKSVMISENNSGSFDGKEFKTGKLDAGQVKEMLDMFQGLNVPPPSNNPPAKEGKGGEQGNGNGEGTGQGGTEQAAETGAAPEMTLADLVFYETAENFMTDYAYENAFDAGVKTSDINEFRFVIDHKGYEALVSQSTHRLDPYILENATTVFRNAGPDIGTTYAIETTTWSAPLPDLWANVVYRPLGDPANLDELGYPIYYRLATDFMAGNPVGDTLEVVTGWHYPNVCVNCGYTWQQGYTQEYYTNNVLQASIDYASNNDIDAVTSTNGLNSYCFACYDNVSLSSIDNGTNKGVDFNYYNYSKQGLFLTQSMTAHDNDGNIVPTSGFGQPNQYFPLSQDYNISVEFKSPNFSQSIDLIFLNPYYSTFNLIQVPTGYSTGCGGC